MAAAIRYSTNNVVGTAHTRNIAATTHDVAIYNASSTATRVQSRGNLFSSPSSTHKTSVHAHSIYSQTGLKHIATMKRDALVGTIMANPSGIPKNIVHNHEYDKTQWVEYRNTFHVMQDIVAPMGGMNNILPPSPHDTYIPMCPTFHN